MDIIIYVSVTYCLKETRSLMFLYFSSHVRFCLLLELTIWLHFCSRKWFGVFLSEDVVHGEFILKVSLLNT